MKPENYSLGLIPIFSLFLSATNKRVPAPVNEESTKNSKGAIDAYNDSVRSVWTRPEIRTTKLLEVEAV